MIRTVKWILIILVLVAGTALLVVPETLLAVGQPASSARSLDANTNTPSTETSPEAAIDATTAAALEPVSTSSGASSRIVLGQSNAEVEGASSETRVDGSVVTIASAGTYVLTGTLSDGQIVVEAGGDDDVNLILDGVDVTCLTGPALHVVNAGNTTLTLADGSTNTLTDGATYVSVDAESGEPNAAVFSADDLIIEGTGTLVVTANYNNGVQSKDDLDIAGGTMIVNAVNDGIKGKDSITVADADIRITAGGDGMQSTNEDEAERGIILIASGILDIDAGEDGIQAATDLTILDGDITIVTADGSSDTSSSPQPGGFWGGWGTTADSTPSAKGLKAAISLTIEGGTLRIDSTDDAVHSNDTLTLNGGTLVLSSGDDGMHADTSLVVNGGDVTILQSYEGVESASIEINGGFLDIVASDDGINGAGGVDGSAMGGRMGQNPFSMGGNYSLAINGGTIVVDADGDGIDVNGTITMSDGIVIVHGPTSNGNGALDHSSFTITGGFLVAAGSAGMAQAPSSSSSQCSVALTFSSTLQAGALIHIASSSGDEVVTFASIKPYQSLVVSSPDLSLGTTYTIYYGGSSTGLNVDGVYAGGTYSDGSQIAQFTITGTVTTLGSSRGGFQGTTGERRPGM